MVVLELDSYLAPAATVSVVKITCRAYYQLANIMTKLLIIYMFVEEIHKHIKL